MELVDLHNCEQKARSWFGRMQVEMPSPGVRYANPDLGAKTSVMSRPRSAALNNSLLHSTSPTNACDNVDPSDFTSG